jgi:GT2 family glycosyltransferase
LDRGRKTIGVVIPTHNRYRQLRGLLASIREHWTDQVESVVVVDDSTQPQELESEFQDLNVRQIILKTRVFISRAKNIGWKSLKTDYVYFIDDDNEIDDSSITPVFNILSHSDSMGALMPAVLYKARPELVWVYATPLSRRSLTPELVGRNRPRSAKLEKRLLNTDALPNASLARREALEDIGGFDEMLVVNSSMDLCLRMKARKWQVYSYTGAFVYHDVEPPGRLGWWATHGASDPERVRYEIRDWFILMHRFRGDKRLFVLRAVAGSRFVIPNMIAYLVRGQSRTRLVKSLWTGYLEGLSITILGESRSSRPEPAH